MTREKSKFTLRVGNSYSYIVIAAAQYRLLASGTSLLSISCQLKGRGDERVKVMCKERLLAHRIRECASLHNVICVVAYRAQLDSMHVFLFYRKAREQTRPLQKVYALVTVRMAFSASPPCI